MRLIALLAVSFLILAASVPGEALAHLTGAFFQTDVGAYTVDIGYSVTNPIAGEPVAFDFQLRHVNSKLNAGSDADFSDVWVKISSDKDVILATGLYNAEFGGPRLSYAFPKAGAYTVSARYETKDGALAETSFPLTVTTDTGAGAPSGNNDIFFGVVGLAVGAAAAFSYRRFLKK